MRAKTGRLPAAVLAAALLAAGCSGDRDAPARPRGAPTVVVRDSNVDVGTWRPPRIEVTPQNAFELADRADVALAEGRFAGDADSAIALFHALQAYPPMRLRAETGVRNAVTGLLQQARRDLADIDGDPDALRRVHEAAAVLRVVALDRPDVERFLQAVDRVDEGLRYSAQGEAALARGDIGEAGTGGALGWFRRALALRATDARALQGVAAAESALIRRAEQAAAGDDYAAAARWLEHAQALRPGAGTVAAARARIAFERAARVGRLRDRGIGLLGERGGIDQARAILAQLLVIAPPGDPAATELRQRIDLAVYYGPFRPGQVFTDAMAGGGRGPQMVVVPRGVFRMGAPPGERGSSDAERPQRPIRFARGFAMARTEITVGEFRRFVEATGYRARSVRRGYSMAYDERSGNFVRRGRVDWTRDYRGQPAREDLPVVHVSAKDATAYAEWLAERTGQRYRLPSEAEFEYALRAGGQGPYPWGEGAPPPGTGNFTGEGDRSPTGRTWKNAFRGYIDGAWGPVPVGRYLPGRFGLHDLAGNVSEWVADCWHASYRRAPRDARAWVNPGCRQRTVRGGSWASSPEQTRSAWRMQFDADTTNARMGFRVVRDL
ncbi:MAG: SUMF1/EgtB/PvdO family nonheme iron enzyme [Pseudomonadota bacterium]